MNRLWKQFFVWCAAIALIASCIPIAAAAAVDVYDEAGLVSALSAGAEVTLWQNFTVSAPLTVAQDSSIDLNGYRLTVTHGLTVANGKTLTVRDSRSAAASGQLSVTSASGAAITLNYGGAALVLESGAVLAKGHDYAASGYGCGEGILGEDGRLTVLGGTLTAVGGNGKDKRDGTGWDEKSPQNACDGIRVGRMTVENGEVVATGGNGEMKSTAVKAYSGAGIYATHGITIRGGSVRATGGAAVQPADAEWAWQLLYGGAGIALGSSAVLSVTGGAVTAAGGPSGAGIGGCAKHGLNGGSVSISGGVVSATAGRDAYDIGGGYTGNDYSGSVGTRGELTVTGGTLRFNTPGRATNVAAPVFRSCTVLGDGAYQHEGTYNADGKLTIGVTNVTAVPAGVHAGASVTLTAQLTISRTTNITTPAPKGSIVFRSNGETLAQATIGAAAAADGCLTASAEADWTATGGSHTITAVYIPGADDRYAPADDAPVSAVCVVAPHHFVYTLKTAPTTTQSGALHGVCSDCAAETDVSLPPLNPTDYTYQITTPPTCTTAGAGLYLWNTTTYGSYRFPVVLSKTDHAYESVVTPPTCTAPGYTTHTCKNCGDSYRDSSTGALGHSYSYAITRKPTAQADGILTETCSRCTATQSIPLPSLSSGAYTYALILPSTCRSEGIGRYTWNDKQYGVFFIDVPVEKAPHSYVDEVVAPTCTEPGYTAHTCAVCGNRYQDAFTSALQHDYKYELSGVPTLSEGGALTGTCRRCGGTQSIPLPRLNTEDYTYVVIQEASCQAEGLGRYYWNNVQYGTHFINVPLEKRPHLYEDTLTAPTCTERGYTTHTCKTCGETYTDTYVNALDHAWSSGTVAKAPTCTEPGETSFTCTRCGAAKAEPINPLGHTYESTVTAPTCTERGYTTHTCKTCGDTYTDAYVNALGHTWSSGTVAKAPTCTEPGETSFTCTRCGAARTEAINPLGHTYESTVTAPTCTERGYTTHTCKTCGNTYTDTYVNALGHVWDDGEITTAPTASKSGVRTYTCTRCGRTRSEVIPATGGVEETPCDGGLDCPGYRFKDMPAASDWAHRGIDFAVSHGLFDGTAPDTFGPKESMTRAMMVTVLWRLEGKPAASARRSFTDVPGGTWYTEPVAWAAEHQIVNGIGGGLFSPDGNITREQMAAIFYRYAAWKGYDTTAKADLSVFPDYDSVGLWARTALSWANAAELITGTREGSVVLLDPAANATRAQVATIFMRFMTTFMAQ